MDYRTKYEELLADNKRLSNDLIQLKCVLVICQQKCQSIQSAFDLSQKLVQQLKTENQLLKSSKVDSLASSQSVNNLMPIIDITNVIDDNRDSNVTTDMDLTMTDDMSSGICKSDSITARYEEQIKELVNDCDLFDCLPTHSVVISSEDQIKANNHLSASVESDETNSRIEVEFDVNDVMSSETSEQKSGSKCKFCGRKFDEQTDLDDHQLLHQSSDGQQIRCAEDLCGHQFNTRRELREHLKAVHKNKSDSKLISIKPKTNRVFECPECKKKLSSNHILKRHRKSFHNIERVYTCNVRGCALTFDNWPLLKSHQQNHKNNKNLVSDGMLCEERSPYFEPLVSSTTICDSESKRKFECPYEGCHSAYVYKVSLKNHEKKRHSNDLISGNTSPLEMDVHIDGSAPNTSKSKGSAQDIQTRLQLLELFHSAQQKD